MRTHRLLGLACVATLLGGCARLVTNPTADAGGSDRPADHASVPPDQSLDPTSPKPELTRDLSSGTERPPVLDLVGVDKPQLDLPKPDLPKPDLPKPDLPKPDQTPPPSFASNPNHPLTIVGGTAALPIESQRTTFASKSGASYGALAFNASGALHAVNLGSGSIDQISTSGVITTFATGVGASSWSRIAIDKAGLLYLSTTATIKKITSAGAISTWTLGTTFSYLTGLAFDAGGDLHAADINTGILHRITPSGTVTTFATGFPFSQLYALAFNLTGEVFVNVGNQSVQRVTPAGAISTFVTHGGRNNYEHGAFDGAGNLYLPLREYNGTSGWSGKGVIVRYSPTGVETQFVPSQGTFAVNPGGLAFDASGRLYASVGENIIRFAP